MNDDNTDKLELDDFPTDGYPIEDVFLDDAGQPIVIPISDLHGSDESRRKMRDDYDAGGEW